MKRIITLLIGAACLLSACDDFLTAKDKSQILETTLFTDQEGVEDALYGIYAGLAQASCYGVNIPLYMDALAQFYRTPSTYNNSITTYKHENPQWRNAYTSLWKDMYRSISDIDNFLDKLDAYEGKKLIFENLYRGEALGMRAYLHFDLLRIFAPIDMNACGIPYITRFGTDVTPFSTVQECYDLIIADLEEAEQLLKADEEYLTLPRVRSHEFIMLRNREVHFNLYAAKATLARVYYMRRQAGDLEKAGQYAREVIESEKFPLVAEPKYVPTMMAGVIAATEGVWGLSNSKLFSSLRSHYFENNNYSSFYENTGAHRNLYQSSNGHDYRSEWFVKGTGQSLKLIDPVENGTSSDAPEGLKGINQIRVVEMYLIAAEACMVSNPEVAKKYLDDLNRSRGLEGFAGNLTTEDLDTEWRKELVQEGQVWFLMKHRQIETVKDDYSGATITMKPEMWQLLIPDEEFEFRDESTY